MLLRQHTNNQDLWDPADCQGQWGHEVLTDQMVSMVFPAGVDPKGSSVQPQTKLDLLDQKALLGSLVDLGRVFIRLAHKVRWGHQDWMGGRE